MWPYRASLSLLLLFVGLWACGSDDDSPAPVYAVVRVNEVMPSNQKTYADASGEYDDWIELYAPGDEPVSLEGWFVSDDPAKPDRAQLTGELTIPAGGVLVLWADRTPEQGPDHLPFKLSAAQESVVLSDPSGRLVDEISWMAAGGDHAFARIPDGEGELVRAEPPSPGDLNGGESGR